MKNLVCEVIENPQSQTSLRMDSQTPHYNLVVTISLSWLCASSDCHECLTAMSVGWAVSCAIMNITNYHNVDDDTMIPFGSRLSKEEI